MPNYPEKGDKAAANAILDKAGYKKDGNGVRLKAVLDIIPYGEDWRRAGEYLKQAMGDIGIQLELRYEDVPTWLKRVYHRYDFEMNVNYFYQLPDLSWAFIDIMEQIKFVRHAFCKLVSL